jgi:hypothetical protein
MRGDVKTDNFRLNSNSHNNFCLWKSYGAGLEKFELPLCRQLGMEIGQLIRITNQLIQLTMELRGHAALLPIEVFEILSLLSPLRGF